MPQPEHAVQNFLADAMSTMSEHACTTSRWKYCTAVIPLLVTFVSPSLYWLVHMRPWLENHGVETRRITHRADMVAEMLGVISELRNEWSRAPFLCDNISLTVSCSTSAINLGTYGWYVDAPDLRCLLTGTLYVFIFLVGPNCGPVHFRIGPQLGSLKKIKKYFLKYVAKNPNCGPMPMGPQLGTPKK